MPPAGLPLPGTSDVIEGPEYSKLLEEATRYARADNVALLARITSGQGSAPR